jgi:hypothetical protein
MSYSSIHESCEGARAVTTDEEIPGNQFCTALPGALSSGT